jgi:hypothetical protein
LVATLDLVAGSPNGWDPRPVNRVRTIAANDAAIYMGGEFDGFEYAPQSWLAAFAETPTSVSITLLSSEAAADRVRLEWYVPRTGVAVASIYRRTTDSDWGLYGNLSLETRPQIVFEDTDVTPGMRYGYRITVRDLAGHESAIETWVDVPGETEVPAVLRLLPARPSPSRGRVELTYGLPSKSFVRLTVYDVHGRRVAVLLDKMEPAGWRTAALEGRDDAGREVGSGTYFLRLEAGETVQVRRAVLVR